MSIAHNCSKAAASPATSALMFAAAIAGGLVTRAPGDAQQWGRRSRPVFRCRDQLCTRSLDAAGPARAPESWWRCGCAASDCLGTAEGGRTSVETAAASSRAAIWSGALVVSPRCCRHFIGRCPDRQATERALPAPLAAFPSWASAHRPLGAAASREQTLDAHWRRGRAARRLPARRRTRQCGRRQQTWRQRRRRRQALPICRPCCATLCPTSCRPTAGAWLCWRALAECGVQQQETRCTDSSASTSGLPAPLPQGLRAGVRADGAARAGHAAAPHGHAAAGAHHRRLQQQQALARCAVAGL
jgi:hypothetical protein